MCVFKRPFSLLQFVSGFGVKGGNSEVRAPGFLVSDSGFGAWALGVGVWGFEV